MSQNEIIVLNFEEIRRRSIKLWNGITSDNYFWRPDSMAMNCLEMRKTNKKVDLKTAILTAIRNNVTKHINPPITNIGYKGILKRVLK